MTMRIRIIAPLAFLALSSAVFSMPNPAAMNCSQPGIKYIMIKNVGICIFPDSTYCEEWAFFRGQCKPGMNRFPGGKYKNGQMNQYCLVKSTAGAKVIICKLMR